MTVVWPAWAMAAAAGLALGVGLVVLLSRRRAIGQTTLVGGWWWSVAAIAAWSLTEIWAALGEIAGGSVSFAPLRFAAMTLSFCPIVAVVGAKRPQDRAWHFVVLALWGIVALPAAETFFMHRGQRLDLGVIRSWFLWILILLGPINVLATRYGFASLLVALGQTVALSPYLALVHRRLMSHGEILGLGICVLGMVATWLQSRRITAAATAYDRLWLDFRDTLGMLWALRVQERVNSAAQQYGWNLELGWNGFRSATGARLTAIDPAVEPALRTTLRGLLRRFVSGPWIAERIAENAKTTRA